jgi:hypothetical protein
MSQVDDLSAEIRRNLVDLRRQSLVMIAVALGAIDFVWLNLLMWPETGGSQLGATFWGAVALMGGVGLAYLLRDQHLRLAAWLLVLGSTVALTVALGQYRLPVLAYLLAIPPMIAGFHAGAVAGHGAPDTPDAGPIRRISLASAGHRVGVVGLLGLGAASLHVAPVGMGRL